MGAFIKEWGAVCGAIAAIIGLFLLFFKPIKKRFVAMRKKRKSFEDNVLQKLEDIKRDVRSLTDDVAELQGDRLMQAHAFYMKQGWCSQERKAILCNWKKSYSEKGYNHLVDTYEKDINGLPESPDAVPAQSQKGES